MSGPGARPTFAERLEDPLSHFPYKQQDAHRGAARVVRTLVVNLGLDDDAEQSLIDALLPFAAAEVDAAAAYVAAQEAFLRDPTDATREAEREAARVLAAARRDYREARPQLIDSAINAPQEG